MSSWQDCNWNYLEQEDNNVYQRALNQIKLVIRPLVAGVDLEEDDLTLRDGKETRIKMEHMENGTFEWVLHNSEWLPFTVLLFTHCHDPWACVYVWRECLAHLSWWVVVVVVCFPPALTECPCVSAARGLLGVFLGDWCEGKKKW